MSQKWDKRFLDVATLVSTWSKDPSTKCGAVIVNPKRHPISVGYNGLPKEMPDDPAILNNRIEKYKHVIHAEANAILNADISVADCALYVTHPCCENCAEFIADSGIRRVVYPSNPEFEARWNAEPARQILLNAGIVVDVITPGEHENE